MGGKPWLNRYDPDVPHSLEPYPDLTLIDVVAENAHRRPNHPALLFKGSQLTYAELDKLSNGFASSLVALGVEKDVQNQVSDAAHHLFDDFMSLSDLLLAAF